MVGEGLTPQKSLAPERRWGGRSWKAGEAFLPPPTPRVKQYLAPILHVLVCAGPPTWKLHWGCPAGVQAPSAFRFPLSHKLYPRESDLPYCASLSLFVASVNNFSLREVVSTGWLDSAPKGRADVRKA